MVVLAASIVTKTGKVLVSRQYVDMSRVRIEGLLAAFPKLISSSSQHTTVETESVRYVYQPMEAMYLLLVTNRASNLLEDLDTLRLLSKVVPEYAQPLEEEAICKAAFDLLFAFDEVISLGYKENVTVAQVRQNTEMESHEERLHKMIIQSKINETKDVMKRKAMEIDKSKVSADKMAEATRMMKPTAITPSSSSRIDSALPSFGRASVDDVPKSKAPSGRGMQLGKGRKGASDFLDSLRAEGENLQTTDAVPAAGAPAGPPAPPPTEPIVISVTEKVMVQLNKDGGVNDMEVQGSMSLQVLAEDHACIQVAVRSGATEGYQFKTHPNIDKAAYTSRNVLGLKDADRPFPIGNPLGILKWRMQTTDEAKVPLLINCWPSASGGESYVNIEYESTVSFDLHNVAVTIPVISASSPPRINQVDGDTQFDARKGTLVWTVDLVDSSNKSGSLEFVVPAARSEDFFPVDVTFSAQHTLCQVAVASVTSAQSGQPMKYAYNSLLSTDGYDVS